MSRAIDTSAFRVKPGRKVDLGKWPTKVPDLYETKDDYKARLAAEVAHLAELQQVFYAANRYGLLVILQAMDAAGKDGVIRHVFSGVNPQGCQVNSFKHPSAEELQHDFLWRTTRRLPERGMIGVFNRSYYEEVLIVRVHPELLRGENVPNGLKNGDVWERRFRSIRDMERHQHESGTRIVKIFLHLSKEEQRQRLLARIDEPDKNWKMNVADVEEREYWKDYMRAYQDCLAETSTKQAPWYAVPADDKENARLIVARIVAETLEGCGLEFPPTSAERKRELAAIRKKLAG